jgi:UDP-N-acetylmuramoylalanine--D-glutamate ligase
MTDYLRPDDFAGRTVLVCGARIAGASAARALVALGARVLVTDAGPSSIAEGLPAGATFLGDVAELPAGLDVVVTSPGLRPEHPLLTAAADAGLPVLGELEFAWRIRANNPALWLMVTGTNGKTTTVRMLESMLLAAGRRALAVGNVGVPVIDAVMAGQSYDVLAVEASSFQLHYSQTITPHAGVVLNLAEDHLDWHGSFSAYALEKSKVWAGEYAIGNADDPAVQALLDQSSAPIRSTFSVHETGRLAFPVHEIRPPGAHNVANALAAAELARTVGVTDDEIAAGLRAFVPDPHRNQLIATVAGVAYVDDSKATNPHAAAASLQAYDRIVWIAGGQLKGASVDGLVAEYAHRLRGAVLLGADRELIAAALTRHAPDLPVIVVSSHDDGAMIEVVSAAASLAAAGDAVLLAPAAASLDMFASYGARGLAFADAVARLGAGSDGPAEAP